MILLRKTYLLFWALALAYLLLGFFSNDATLDINVHDTYFVIRLSELHYNLSLLFFMLGLGYWVLKTIKGRPLVGLTILHILFSIPLAAIIIISAIQHHLIHSETYYVNSSYSMSYELSILISVALFLLGQIICILNFTIAIYKRRKY
ncbi:MAG: hypothetical protein AAFP76_15730 [Bacteroidota bacterium]